jgi:two-component system, NtrC family, nitrogen regulation response regulator NtrX
MADDILIVDDEADIRELVSGILQDEGYITRSARDSDDALAHVASRRPSLVYKAAGLTACSCSTP